MCGHVFGRKWIVDEILNNNKWEKSWQTTLFWHEIVVMRCENRIWSLIANRRDLYHENYNANSFEALKNWKWSKIAAVFPDYLIRFTK